MINYHSIKVVIDNDQFLRSDRVAKIPNFDNLSNKKIKKTWILKKPGAYNKKL